MGGGGSLKTQNFLGPKLMGVPQDPKCSKSKTGGGGSLKTKILNGGGGGGGGPRGGAPPPPKHKTVEKNTPLP